MGMLQRPPLAGRTPLHDRPDFDGKRLPRLRGIQHQTPAHHPRLNHAAFPQQAHHIGRLLSGQHRKLDVGKDDDALFAEDV